MTTFFEDLIGYNYQSNMQVIDALVANEVKSSPKAMELLGHMQLVHAVWNRRAATASQVSLWEAAPAAGQREVEAINHANTLQLVRQVSLPESIHYKTNAGDARADSLQDILFHIINHSTYHRAQIATECRQHGIEPVATDYILYRWKNKSHH